MMVYESWLNKNRKVLWQGMKRQVVEGQAKQSEYRKREDEAMNGDGVVTMRHMKKLKKKLMERFACKWAYGCKTW